MLEASVEDHRAFKQLVNDVRSRGKNPDLTLKMMLGAIIRLVEAAGVDAAVEISKSPEEVGRTLLRIAADVREEENLVRVVRGRAPHSKSSSLPLRGGGDPSVPGSEPNKQRLSHARSADPAHSHGSKAPGRGGFRGRRPDHPNERDYHPDHA